MTHWPAKPGGGAARAERRAGQLLKDMTEKGELAVGLRKTLPPKEEFF
jgi:hypothetical protein